MKELTIKETIKVLNVSERTIRRMIKRGDLPNAQKRDRKIWIPQSDIDAYLRKQKEEASGPEAKPATKPKPKPKSKPKPEPTPPPKEAKIEPEPAPLVEAEPEIKPSEPEITPTPVEVPEPEPEPEVPSPGPEPEPPVAEEAPPEEEPEPAAPPTAEPEQPKTPYQEPRFGQPTQGQGKELFVKAGINSLNWLEKHFKKMREKLEEYKDRMFSE